MIYRIDIQTLKFANADIWMEFSSVLQGVTLTDLQEAEKTFSRSRAERHMQEQPSEKSERIESKKEESERWEDTARREPGETLSRWNRNLDEEVNK